MTNTDHIPTVKMYKEETVCCECGRYIKNVVEIDGAQYGVRCCEKYLPRHYSVKKGIVVANTDKMIADAKTIMGERYIPFSRKTAIELNAYIAARIAECPQPLIAVENMKGIALILAARNS